MIVVILVVCVGYPYFGGGGLFVVRVNVSELALEGSVVPLQSSESFRVGGRSSEIISKRIIRGI